MPSLRDMQRGFAAAILYQDATATAPLIRSHGVSPARRLDIYRVSIFENYRKALAAMFPVVQQLVGVGYFSLLAAEYVRATPSDSGDVGDYGAAFAAFLDAHAVSTQLPYLGDVARLEWAIELTFHAEDSNALSLQSLATLNPDNVSELRLKLASRCRLLQSHYPIHRIWEVNQPHADTTATVDLNEGAVNLLVIRHNGPYSVAVRPLAPGDFAMLHTLSEGAPLGAALATTIASHESFDLGTFLQTYVPPGVLSAFAIGPERSVDDARLLRSPSFTLN